MSLFVNYYNFKFSFWLRITVCTGNILLSQVEEGWIKQIQNWVHKRYFCFDIRSHIFARQAYLCESMCGLNAAVIAENAHPPPSLVVRLITWKCQLVLFCGSYLHTLGQFAVVKSISSFLQVRAGDSNMSCKQCESGYIEMLVRILNWKYSTKICLLIRWSIG